MTSISNAEQAAVALHAPIRETVGSLGMVLYHQLNYTLASPAPLPGTLHGGMDLARIQTGTLNRVEPIEDAKILGYHGVYTTGARTETWVTPNGSGTEVEIELFSGEPTQAPEVIESTIEDIFERVDTVGLSGHGDAYINGSDRFTRVRDDQDLWRPGWRARARADCRTLQVAATALVGAEAAWPRATTLEHQEKMWQFQRWYNNLRELLGEPSESATQTEWYAPLPGTDYLAGQVKIHLPLAS